MVLELAHTLQIKPSNGMAEGFPPDACELVAFCPGCKTMETLWFNGDCLMQTHKFNQRGEQVFHDCGTSEPCRLYRPS